MKDKYNRFNSSLLLSRDQMQWLADNAFGKGKVRCEVDYVNQTVCWFWKDLRDEEPELDEIFDKFATELDVKCITWIGPTFDGDIVIVYEGSRFSWVLPWTDNDGTPVDLAVKAGRYCVNGKFALALYKLEDGRPVERFASLTKNIEEVKLDGSKGFVNVDEFPKALDFIEKYNLGKPAGETATQVLTDNDTVKTVNYPVVEFNLDVIGTLVFNQTEFDVMKKEIERDNDL